MAPIQPPAFTNTHCSSSSGNTWPGCSRRSSTISLEKASSWSSPGGDRGTTVRASTTPNSGKAPLKLPARLGPPQPSALHPFTRPVIRRLTRVLPGQLCDLFVLEDEALRAHPEPDHLGQHSCGSQEQRGPQPPPAHCPLHPGGRPGRVAKEQTGAWNCDSTASKPAARSPLPFPRHSRGTACADQSEQSGHPGTAPRVEPFPLGERGAPRGGAEPRA